VQKFQVVQELHGTKRYHYLIVNNAKADRCRLDFRFSATCVRWVLTFTACLACTEELYTLVHAACTNGAKIQIGGEDIRKIVILILFDFDKKEHWIRVHFGAHLALWSICFSHSFCSDVVKAKINLKVSPKAKAWRSEAKAVSRPQFFFKSQIRPTVIVNN